MNENSFCFVGELRNTLFCNRCLRDSVISDNTVQRCWTHTKIYVCIPVSYTHLDVYKSQDIVCVWGVICSNNACDLNRVRSFRMSFLCVFV